MVHLEAVADARPRTQAPPSTILVVDDNPLNLQLVVRTLAGSGHRILAARNGAAALEITRRAAPDLVLLDVLMPDMSGFDVYMHLNARQDGPQVPVIFLSALDDVADKIAGLGLAPDYVTKPIQPDEVRARVDNHLTRLFLERELRRSRDRLDRELADAAELQRLMLPQAMPRGFAAHYRTSRHAGGDYYDVLRLDDNRLSFIVADVSGHGASAAIVMAMIRTLFHTLGEAAGDPEAALRRIDAQFDFLRDSAVFATAAYGVIDTAHRTIRFASAGHPLPLVWRPGEDTTALRCEGRCRCSSRIPRQSRWPNTRCPLAIASSCTRTGSPIDRRRPATCMKSIASPPPSRAAPPRRPGVVEHIVGDIEAFAAGAEPADDQTLLVIAIDRAPAVDSNRRHSTT
jgi:CheY-like chemotaxis protein